MRINTNVSALNTHRQMTLNANNATKSMEKLSSGLRINRAADDAAGLSISEKMRSQISGLEQASRNAQDGVSYLQTAEGALNEVSNMLVRMKELNVQKANGTYSTEDTANIDLELDALGDEIDSILTTTKFNGIDVFAGKSGVITGGKDGVVIALGHDGGTKLEIEAATLTDVKGLGNGSTATNIETAITAVNKQRATYGALQNRLEYSMNNMGTTTENLTAAESRIRDVDMASEMAEFTKQNILTQAAQSMLAQANQQPQNVLSLLR